MTIKTLVTASTLFLLAACARHQHAPDMSHGALMPHHQQRAEVAYLVAEQVAQPQVSYTPQALPVEAAAPAQTHYDGLGTHPQALQLLPANVPFQIKPSPFRGHKTPVAAVVQPAPVASAMPWQGGAGLKQGQPVEAPVIQRQSAPAPVYQPQSFQPGLLPVPPRQ